MPYRLRGLMAASIDEHEGEVKVGVPEKLFQMNFIRPTKEDWQVSADGQRFLIKTPAKGATRVPLHLLLNWPSRLETRR